jgi:hypothetical protein
MIVFVHQPEYIPWLGFFDKLAKCDTFVIYDDAQFQHGGFHNRNRIRTVNGWCWLTVPIVHGYPQTIKDVRISGANWQRKQKALITHSYERTPYFKDYFPIIERVIDAENEWLLDLDLKLIEELAGVLGIKVNMVRSSQFPYLGEEKNEKLVSMCKFLGADTYLAGSGGKAYVDESLFAAANIKVKWHRYVHPTYPQSYLGFEPNLSIIDLLFNSGPEAKKIMIEGGVIEKAEERCDWLVPQRLVLAP